jgi:hypothetical protein
VSVLATEVGQATYQSRTCHAWHGLLMQSSVSVISFKSNKSAKAGLEISICFNRFDIRVQDTEPMIFSLIFKITVSQRSYTFNY